MHAVMKKFGSDRRRVCRIRGRGNVSMKLQPKPRWSLREYDTGEGPREERDHFPQDGNKKFKFDIFAHIMGNPAIVSATRNLQIFIESPTGRGAYAKRNKLLTY